MTHDGEHRTWIARRLKVRLLLRAQSTLKGVPNRHWNISSLMCLRSECQYFLRNNWNIRLWRRTGPAHYIYSPANGRTVALNNHICAAPHHSFCFEKCSLQFRAFCPGLMCLETLRLYWCHIDLLCVCQYFAKMTIWNWSVDPNTELSFLRGQQLFWPSREYCAPRASNRFRHACSSACRKKWSVCGQIASASKNANCASYTLLVRAGRHITKLFAGSARTSIQ